MVECQIESSTRLNVVCMRRQLSRIFRLDAGVQLIELAGQL